MTPHRWAVGALFTAALLALAACASWVAGAQVEPTAQRFQNPYVAAEDTGERVPGTYFLRRAWVQITRDLSKTEVPPTGEVSRATGLGSASCVARTHPRPRHFQPA